MLCYPHRFNINRYLNGFGRSIRNRIIYLKEEHRDEKIILFASIILLTLSLISIDGMSKDKGDKCFSDGECGFGLTCNDGACVKKRQFDFSSSVKLVSLVILTLIVSDQESV